MVMSTLENKTSKDSTKITKDVNVTLVDVANENFTKLVNEVCKGSARVCTSDPPISARDIGAARNAIQTMTSVQKQFVNSNSSFNNVVVSDTGAPYVQRLCKTIK